MHSSLGANQCNFKSRDGLYALQTILCWYIVGPIESTSGKVGAVTKLLRVKLELIRFRATTLKYKIRWRKVEESGIKEMFERMYQLDFSKSNAKVHDVMTKKLEDISYGDNKFLKLMDKQTVKVSNHYQTALLQWNPVMKLPNNRKIV